MRIFNLFLVFLTLPPSFSFGLNYSERRNLIEEGREIVESGSREEILKFIRRVEAIENEWELPRSIVRIAVGNEDLETVLTLIEKGSEIFCPDAETIFKVNSYSLPILQSIKSFHPLYFRKAGAGLLAKAIHERRADLIDFFVDAQVDLNDRSYPCLTSALFTYQTEIVIKLVEAGANPDVRTGEATREAIDGIEKIIFDKQVDLAYKLKFLEAVEYLDKEGKYDEQLESLRDNFPYEESSSLLGTWKNESREFVGSNLLTVKKDATAVLRAGSLNIGFMWKRDDSGAKFFPVDIASGELDKSSDTYAVVSENGDYLDLKKGDTSTRFIKVEGE